MGNVEELRQMFANNPELKQQMLAQIQGQRKAGLLGQMAVSPKATNVQKMGVEEQLRDVKRAEALAGAEATGFTPRPESITAAGETTFKIPQTAEEKLQEQQDALQLKRTEAQAGTEAQLETQKRKSILTSQQDLTNARLKIGNAFDSWLEAVDRTKQITGVDPGVLGGVITEVLGKTKANEFVNAFKGGLVEYAAAVGRVAIPGARATRLINLFKTTAPTAFDTVPSAIEQSALSFKNGLATDMSREPSAYLPEVKDRRLTPEDYSKLDEMLREFQNQYREGLYKQAFDKNPELLPPDIRQRLEAEATGQLTPGLGDDEINALLDREGAGI